MGKSDIYCDEIREAFKKGGDEAMQLFRRFYKRVDLESEWTVSKLTANPLGACITFENQDGFKHDVKYNFQTNRWFYDRPVSDADVSEDFCLPVSFLEGVRFALSKVLDFKKSNLYLELKNEEAELKVLIESMRNETSRLLELKTTLENKIPNLSHSLASRPDKAVFRSIGKAYFDRIVSERGFPRRQGEIGCHHAHNMPSVDLKSARLAVDLAAGSFNVSGIYIAFRGNICEYVGKSTSISNRLKSHHKVKPDHMVCVIELPEEEIHFAEMYYIWLLRPTLNNEGEKTEKSKSKKIQEPDSILA